MLKPQSDEDSMALWNELAVSDKLRKALLVLQTENKIPHALYLLLQNVLI